MVRFGGTKKRAGRRLALVLARAARERRPLPQRAGRSAQISRSERPHRDHQQRHAGAGCQPSGYRYTWFRCTSTAPVRAARRCPARRQVLRAADGRHRALACGRRCGLERRRQRTRPSPPRRPDRRRAAAQHRPATDQRPDLAAQTLSATPGTWTGRVPGGSRASPTCGSAARPRPPPRAPTSGRDARNVHVHRRGRGPPHPSGGGRRGARPIPGRLGNTLGPVFARGRRRRKRLTPVPGAGHRGPAARDGDPHHRVRRPGAAARQGERALQGQAVPVPAASAARSASASGCASAARSAPTGPDRCWRSGSPGATGSASSPASRSAAAARRGARTCACARPPKTPDPCSAALMTRSGAIVRSPRRPPSSAHTRSARPTRVGHRRRQAGRGAVPAGQKAPVSRAVPGPGHRAGCPACARTGRARAATPGAERRATVPRPRGAPRRRRRPRPAPKPSPKPDTGHSLLRRRVACPPMSRTAPRRPAQ